MVARAVVYYLDRCTLVCCNAPVSLDFLDHRLDGAINGGGTRLFTMMVMFGILRCGPGPLFFIGIPLFLVGLILTLRCLD